MRLLLDTHVLIWALEVNPQIGPVARAELGNPDNDIYVSAVTVWEIAIKRALGKLDAPPGVVALIQASGFIGLPVSLAHAEGVADLPRHHGDPFDRLLIAQARAEGLIIVTSDRQIPAYDVLSMRADR